jgi:hypothetical protein
MHARVPILTSDCPFSDSFVVVFSEVRPPWATFLLLRQRTQQALGKSPAMPLFAPGTVSAREGVHECPLA